MSRSLQIRDNLAPRVRRLAASMKPQRSAESYEIGSCELESTSPKHLRSEAIPVDLDCAQLLAVFSRESLQ